MIDAIADAFRFQSDACGRLGSPLSARLCDTGLADIEAGGPLAGIVSHWDPDLDPKKNVVALRLLGTAHRLVLLGQAPDLARHYPSAGGAPGAGMEADFLALVSERADAFIAGLGEQVQTNEVGRAAVLFPGLSMAAATTGLPVRLLEIGTAAGLNLRLDHFGYDLGGVVLDGSPMLVPEWNGAAPSLVAPDIVERRGCDLEPIDVVTEAGAARAESFVWPDMTERFERMAAAVAVARKVPARLDAVPAGEWLDELFTPADGALTVLQHSVMWQYLPGPDKAAIEALVDERGARSTVSAPLAQLAFEPRFREDGSWTFELTLRMWPGGRRRRLATAHPHGAWVRWRE